MHAEILARAEGTLAALGLAYRVLDLCTGDLGQSHGGVPSTSRCTMPPGLTDQWLEASSVSWFSDYQARRANIRYRRPEGGNAVVHTLNGSALAVPRVWAALVETHRQPDGTVVLPEALLYPYLRGATEIPSLSRSGAGPGPARAQLPDRAESVETGAMTTPGPQAVLVRHGETVWSATGRHTGRTDVSLTEIGEAQARALRATHPPWQGRSFAVVLCSPLARAVRTAELAGLTDLALEPDLMEWDYGEFEGRTTDEIRRLIPRWTVWDGPCPGGETIERVGERADRVVARSACPPRRDHRGPGRPRHVLRVLAARWLGAQPVAGRWPALGTGTLSELGWEHETAVIDRWNLLTPGRRRPPRDRSVHH